MKSITLCDDGDYQKVSELAVTNGFGMEIQHFYIPERCDSIESIELHKEKIKQIVNLSFHAPFGDLCPGSGDDLLREVARLRFEQGYKVAKELNASSIIFHIGYVPGTSSIENWSRRCIKFWEEFLENKPNDTNFYIENVLEYNPSVIEKVISGLNRDNVKACLDIGHAHCNSKVSVLEWIETLKDKIGYVHLHDNNGEQDEHLGLGKGTIPLIEVFQALNKYAPNAIWALECRLEDMEESVELLKRHVAKNNN